MQIRQLGVMFLSFVFAFSSVATPAPIKPQVWVADYVKTMGLLDREQSFRNLIDRSRTEMDSGQYATLVDFSNRFPTLRVPRAKIRQVQAGSDSQVLQVMFEMSGQSATLEVSEQDGHAVLRMIGAFDKKPKSIKIDTSQSEDEIRALATQFVQEAFEIYSRRPRFQLLSYEEVSRLSRAEKKQYYLRVQGLIESAERVQNAQKQRGKTSAHFIFELLSPVAHADNSKAQSGDNRPCFQHGYATTYSGNECGRGDSRIVRRSGEVQCNSDIYGERVWIPEKGSVTCADKARSVTDSFPETLKTPAEFNERRDALLGAFAESQTACEMAAADPKKSSKDIVKSCQNLANRNRELMALTCLDLKKKEADRFSSLDCGQNPAVVIEVPKIPEVSQDMGQCLALGVQDTEKLNCPAAQQQEVAGCAKTYRCACKDSEEPQKQEGQTFETGCVAKGIVKEVSEKKDDKKSAGFFANIPSWAKYLGVFALGFALGWMLKGKKTKTITNTITVPGAPIPGPTVYVPVPGPTVTVPVPGPTVTVPVPGPTVYVPYTPPVRGTK